MTSQAPADGGRPTLRSAHVLWALGAVVAVALVAGAVTAAVREPVALPGGTPERTVQAYIEAVLDDDVEEAIALLSRDLAERCRADDFRRAAPRSPTTVTLDGVRVRNGRAEVTVRLRSDGGEPLLPIFESSFRQWFGLVQEGGDWVIAEAPWPVHHCPGPARAPDFPPSP